MFRYVNMAVREERQAAEVCWGIREFGVYVRSPNAFGPNVKLFRSPDHSESWDYMLAIVHKSRDPSPENSGAVFHSGITRETHHPFPLHFFYQGIYPPRNKPKKGNPKRRSCRRCVTPSRRPRQREPISSEDIANPLIFPQNSRDITGSGRDPSLSVNVASISQF